jgi:hypothetical protein
MSTPVSAMVKALATHLRTLSGLTVREGWPPANQTLTYPSLTVLTGKPTFTNEMPYELEATDPNEDNETVVKRVVGQYDVRLQLDLWARNAYERDAQFERIFAKLNPNIDPMGLSLQLTDYHDLFARFDLVEQEFLDDEATAQRQEWRMRLTVLATCKAVLTKTEYAMIHIENNLTTPDTI